MVKPKVLSKPDFVTRAACCLVDAAKLQIEAHGLTPWKRGGYTPHGPDWTCEDCSGVFVTYEGSDAVFNAVTEKCTNQRDWKFTLHTGRCVDDSPGKCAGGDGCKCGGVVYGCSGEFDETTGCPALPEPLLRQDCTDNELVTVASEGAALWREDYVISKTVADVWECCLAECGFKRCDATNMTAGSGSTEGNCAIVEYQFVIRY